MADRLFEDMGQRAREAPVPPAPPFLPVLGPSSMVDEELASDRFDDDPALLVNSEAVESLGLRVRAVAYTRPLHDLETNKVRLGGEAWARLNMIELGFHAIDVVALRMDFDSGARYDDVVVAVSALARLEVPELEDPERVGAKVVEGLITGRSTTDAEAHSGVYGSWGTDGYVARRFDYALITEHVDAEGELYLRATDPAISVLIGALELDVESAQIAAELRLNELVKRGMLRAAVEEARRARYRSIAYAEQLRRQLSAARLQTTEPGTLRRVDELIDHALAHVVDRYKAERLILANVARTRDAAEEPKVLRRANQLIEELEECERRHQELHRRLIRARTEFRQALATQLAVPPAAPSRVDLERQLLRPVLEAALVTADAVAGRVFTLTSPRAVTLPDLSSLAGALCAMPAEDAGLGETIDHDTELVDAPPSERFDLATWETVDALLEGVTAPERLSALVANLPDGGPAAHLLALRAVHALDPGLAEQVRASQLDAPTTFLLAVADGMTFAAGGIGGDDLLLTSARVSRLDTTNLDPAAVVGAGTSADGDPVQDPPHVSRRSRR